MKFLYPVVLCGLMLLFTSTLKAQDDYAVANNGDTLKCSIKVPYYGGYPKYETSSGKSGRLDPAEYKVCYIKKHDRLYRSLYALKSKKREFMIVVQDGKINLYATIYNYNNFTSTGSMRTSTLMNWYISKGLKDTVISLKTNAISFDRPKKDRKDDFGEMLQDNPAVYDKYIADDKFTYSQISDLVHLYNTGQKNDKVIPFEP